MVRKEFSRSRVSYHVVHQNLWYKIKINQKKHQYSTEYYLQCIPYRLSIKFNILCDFRYIGSLIKISDHNVYIFSVNYRLKYFVESSIELNL